LGDASDAPIPLPNVNGKILEKVIEYCKYHYEHPTPQSEEKKDEKRTDDIAPWDRDFCQVDQATLFELILVNRTPSTKQVNLLSSSCLFPHSLGLSI
jgi:hypothetical protein